MDSNVKRTHYYHAEANALGGLVRRPLPQRNIPVEAQAPVSLSPVGGTASGRADRFDRDGVVSMDGATTEVIGSVSTKNGAWTTLVTVTVKGLNVLNILKADSVTAQIETEHPRVGYNPTVSFQGTEFKNLEVGGRPINVDIDYELCSQAPAGQYPQVPCINDGDFLARVSAQRSQVRTLPGWVKDRNIPDWVSQPYAWDNGEVDPSGNGFVLCSLVKKTNGEFQGRPFGHVLEVPNFGKIFLAELLVSHGTFRLTMIRLQLGSPAEADLTACDSQINGRTEP